MSFLPLTIFIDSLQYINGFLLSFLQLGVFLHLPPIHQQAAESCLAQTKVTGQQCHPVVNELGDFRLREQVFKNGKKERKKKDVEKKINDNLAIKLSG